MHRLECIAVALLAASCSTVPQHLRPAGPSPDPLTWKTRAVFDSALAAGDTARLAALFAPGAFVVAAAGDTLPARDAIVAYLHQLGADAREIRFSWGREGDLERCVGGARERLVYNARLNRADGSASAVSGRLAVFWVGDSSGTLKVAWLAFSKKEISRTLARDECPSVDAETWRSWRWALSIDPTPGFGRGMRSSMESVLRQRGWSDYECSCTQFADARTPISDWKTSVLPSRITVGRYVKRHMVADVSIGRSPHGTTVGARTFPNRDYAHTRFWYSGGFVQAVISYDHWPFQLGAGPLLQYSHLRMRDSLVPYSTGGPSSFRDTVSNGVRLALVANARYNMLVGSRTFLTFRAELHPLPIARTPATARFPAASLDQWGAVFGVGVGVMR